MQTESPSQLGRASRERPGWFSLFPSAVLGILLAACSIVPSTAQTGAGGTRVRVLGVENFYADIASQVGGSHVQASSILSDPNVDPHVYESSVDDAKLASTADVVVKNGAGYDAFIDHLLAASPRANRIVIDVGQLTGHQQGDNPHLWYDTFNTMPALVAALTKALSQKDPADEAYFTSRGQAFLTSLEAIRSVVDTIKQKHGGTPVLATEPLFNYLAAAAGLDMLDAEGPFQKATQDGHDPPAEAVVKFRGQLTRRAAKLLIFNLQAQTPLSEEMQALAKQNNVPVVGVSETEPPSMTYQQWMSSQLQAVLQALGGSTA